MATNIPEIIETLRGHREGLGNLTENVEAMAEVMGDFDRIRVMSPGESDEWRRLGDELAASALAFQRHVDALALVGKLLRRLPMGEE